MSSQIGSIIYLPNCTSKANILHRSLIKYKQVIYSILAAELYGMAYKFNIKAIIKARLGKILGADIILIL